MIGRAVGNYRVEKLLGEGGMGSVYLVRHVRLPNTVAALKVLINAADAPHVAQRFVQEALVAAAIGGHRVARPLDLGRFDDGAPYILMELVEGCTLSARIAEGPLAATSLVSIAFRLADTVALAHARGIIHRDLKPSNIMLVGTDQVKLLDFGVARAAGELKLAKTRESAIVGTPGYLSPEAAAGGAVDAKTDVFSLGIVIYQMATGKLPFPATLDPKSLAALLTDDPIPPSRQRPTGIDPLPPMVDELVAAALSKEPGARPSMDAFRDRLGALLEDLRPGSMPSRLDEPVALPQSHDPLAKTVTHIEDPSDLARLRARVEKFAARRLDSRKRSRLPYWISAAVALALVAIVLVRWATPESRPHGTRLSRHAPDVAQHQLTFTGTAELIGLSPDGRTLCYFSGQSYRFLDLTTHLEREVPRIPGAYMARWLADSSAIEVLTYKAAYHVFASGTVVTKPHDGYDYEVYSRDGTAAFTSTNGREIHLRTSDGQLRDLPIRGDYAMLVAFELAWSPDGNALLVTTLAGRTAYSGPSTLWELGVSTGEQRRLAEAQIIRNPRFVGGGVLYLASDAGPSGGADLMYVQAPGGKPVRLVDGLDALDREALLVDMSSDDAATRLVYLRRTRPHELWLASDSTSTRLMSDTSVKFAPQLSPDGRSIAYVGADGREFALFVVSAAGGTPRRVGGLQPRRVAWSPDGRALAVLSTDEPARLWIQPLDGTSAREIVVDAISPEGVQSVAWAPGPSIVVQSHDHRNITVVDPTTGSARILLEPAEKGRFFAPLMSPDGSWISAWRNAEAGPDQNGMCLISSDGKTQRLVRTTSRVNPAVAWSRDAQWLYGWLDEQAPGQDGNAGGVQLARFSVASESSQSLPAVRIANAADCSVALEGSAIACTSGTATDVWLIDDLEPILREARE